MLNMKLNKIILLNFIFNVLITENGNLQLKI